MRSQRWGWTHTYGVHLLVASVVSVILAGSGLIAVVMLGGDPGEVRVLPSGSPTVPPPDPPPPPPPPPSPLPEVTPTPVDTPVAVDPDCVVGSWQAVGLEDIALTGTWTLAAGGPTFDYRDNGTGTIDYGEPGGELSTTFEFEDLFGNTSNSVPSGQRQFQYAVEEDTIRLTYLDIFGGARMHSIPYSPNEDTFTTVCEGDTMTMSGDKGFVDLRRRDS